MKTFNLTYSQVKALLQNHDRTSVEEFLNAMNDQPEFLQECGAIDSVSELISLYECGCSSNAHWSVYYANALECMSKYSDSVEEQLEHFESVNYDVANDTFAQFCSQLCTMAVESFVYDQNEFIDTLRTTNY